MAVVVSGNVSAGTPVNGNLTLTFTDTSTGVSSLVSRILNIYDSNGTPVVSPINMGATLTATYVTTTDKYLSFVEIIVDNTGTYPLTVNYLSTTFYQISFANAIAALPNDFNCGSEQLTYIDISNLYAQAAERYALSALAPAAQNAINAANYFITGQV